MGFWKTAGQLAAGAARVSGKLGVEALKASGTALHGTARFVSEHQHEIAGATRAVVSASGRVVKEVGRAVSAGAEALARDLHEAGTQADDRTGKVVGHTVGYVADAVRVVGRVTGSLGEATQKSAPVIGEASASAVSGVVGTVSGAVDTVAITERDFARLQQRLQKASAVVRAQSRRRVAAIELAQRERRKKDLLDLLVVGGVTLAEVLRHPAAVSPEVEEAFARAYPGLAGTGEGFAEAVQRMSAEGLQGLVNGVKGKLFEMQLVDHLNDGNLPDGLRAQLAGSATQAGHDIEIVDEQGHIAELLQAKATESAAYVREALARYPDVDVTTTTEVHARLVALGGTDRVADSGISEAALQQKVEAAVQAGQPGDAMDLMPSSVGLAVIALSSFMDESLTPEQRGAEFGGRAAKLGVTGAAAKTVLMVTHTWWLGLAAGVGSSWLSTYGGNKRQRYEALQRTVASLERQAIVAGRTAVRPG